MREMKPLILPKLVAARKSSKSSLDMAYDPTSSVYSCADSGFYSASDCSTPPTPSYSSRGHLRFPSATSSLSSSPPTHDLLDASNASGKLPKLTEEPIEREEDHVMADLDRCSCDSDSCGHDRPQTRASVFGPEYDFTKDYFSDGSESHLAKRRRSMESTTQSLTNRIENRFPSLSRKLRDRNGASTLGRSSRSATPSRGPSRATSTRVPSTRSSSITSSIHQAQGIDLSDKFPPASARASQERLDESTTPSPIDITKANAFDANADGEQDVVRFATTPLLPPLLIKSRLEDVPAQSPLQSPSVADPNQSLVTTPIDTPPFRDYPTPPLSTKPSISSFKMSRPGHLVPSSDIPPLMISDPEKKDPWVNKLGHANFTIQPEPYVPEICDTASVRQLFADWEQARCNFTKHQVRMGEHYGVTSKYYRLSEEKWAQIDNMWKTNHEAAVSRAAAMGQGPEPTSPVEPAPLSIMPSLDPKSEGKFPKLGDEDIVGPMVQIASPIQKTPTRKRAFFKFFGDIRFPSSFLGRSSAGSRGR